MKKISELGLELIKLEDQVLLVDKNSKIIGGNWYYNSYYNTVNRRDGYVSAGKSVAGITVSKVIASTKPLEELPLLVIDYGIIGKPLDDYIKTKANQDQCIGFIEGYNKAKETFKFTEEDLMKCLKVVYDDWCEDKGHVERTEKEYFERIIQSLTKKELWIEVEEKEYPVSSVSFDSVKFSKFHQPWIKNNQIKAVWK